MHTDKNRYFHEGWYDYYKGLEYKDNPYTCVIFGHPPDEWFDWYEGYDAAYLQDNRTG